MSNDLAKVIPQILAMGLLALRQNAITALLVNRQYDPTPGKKGSTVDVPIPSAIVTRDVVPGPTQVQPAAITPTSVPVTVDKWKEAPFSLTDKNIAEAMSGTVPMHVSEAVKSLINDIDKDGLSLYKKVYGFHGTPGTTPFATGTTDGSRTRKVLNDQLAPLDPRYFLINTDTEANMLDLRAFNDTNFAVSADNVRSGKLTQKLGFGWAMNQNLPTHTAGTAASATTNNAGYALGVKTVTLASAGTGTILEGDIITFAGDSQTYVVTAGDADVSNGGTISFEPGLKKAIAASATAITVKATHAVNLAFHRDALALAMRPLEDEAEIFAGGSRIMSAQDPISGLGLRLEVSREHKQTTWSFDALWGWAMIRPELAARCAG